MFACLAHAHAAGAHVHACLCLSSHVCGALMPHIGCPACTCDKDPMKLHSMPGSMFNFKRCIELHNLQCTYQDEISVGVDGPDSTAVNLQHMWAVMGMARGDAQGALGTAGPWAEPGLQPEHPQDATSTPPASCHRPPRHPKTAFFDHKHHI